MGTSYVCQFSGATGVTGAGVMCSAPLVKAGDRVSYIQSINPAATQVNQDITADYAPIAPKDGFVVGTVQGPTGPCLAMFYRE